MYRPNTTCRACGSKKLTPVFDLGAQPLANDFRKEDEERAGHAPLCVMRCHNCGLGQLSVVVRPEILYSKYSYVTSPSEMMRKHFEQLLADIKAETGGTSVLEIGSNDGLLLAMMQEQGFSVLGVDPAENLAEIARSRGVHVQSGFFSEQLARLLPKSDIVIARHVFCHVDDWKDFVRGLEAVSNKETIICIEAPYAADTLKKCEFDQCYHEHLSFLSIQAMQALLAETSLHIHRIFQYPIHGGAIMIMLRTNDCGINPHPSVSGFKEDITAEDWKAFAVEARSQIDRLRATVTSLIAQGKRVAGIGASAKSTVWVNACGFTRNEIAFIADSTPQKLYTTSPGTNIPIVDEGAIMRELPDYVVMWAWNYRDELLEKYKLAREKGVKFIIPVPRIDIV